MKERSNNKTKLPRSKNNRMELVEQELENYQGRLGGITKKISSQEVIDFQDFITRTVEPDFENKLRKAIALILDKDYKRDLSDIDPTVIFAIANSRILPGNILARLPRQFVENALFERELILEAFNHPLRIKVRSLYEEDLAGRGNEMRPFEPLPAVEASEELRISMKNGPLRGFDEFVFEIPPGRKVSRQLALSIGVYCPIGRGQISIPFGSETMHGVIGNPMALADIVRCHAIASVPRNGRLSIPFEQAQLLKDTIAILNDSWFLEGREDRKLIVSQWKSNLGILVEANPDKACRRIEAVYNKLTDSESFGHVRIYMVESGSEISQTAQLIKREFPHLKIHAGQIASISQAFELEELEISSIGIGLASGSRCSTSARSGVPVQNINFLWELRHRGLTTPVFAETGIPHQAAPTALICGIRRINYTAGILGFLNSTGHWFALENRSGELVHPYDGEAGEESKRKENRIYAWNMPIMLEGENGWLRFDSEQRKYPTIPHRLWYLTETVALTSSFRRHLFLEDVHYDPKMKIRRLSQSLMRTVLPYKIS